MLMTQRSASTAAPILRTARPMILEVRNSTHFADGGLLEGFTHGHYRTCHVGMLDVKGNDVRLMGLMFELDLVESPHDMHVSSDIKSVPTNNTNFFVVESTAELIHTSVSFY